MKRFFLSLGIYSMIFILVPIFTSCTDETDEIEIQNEPYISSVVPDAAYPGEHVSIYIEGIALTGSTSITFTHDQSAEILSINDQEVVVKVPVESTTGKIKVQINDQSIISEEEFEVEKLPYEKVRIAGKESGYAIHLGQDEALIGARANGEVYHYKKTIQGWEEVEILNPSLPIDEFGSSISVSGDQAVIGCGQNDYVFIFRKQGDRWQESTYLFEGEGKSYGKEVSIFEEWVSVAAPSEDAVYLYQKKSTGQWAMRKKLIGQQGEAFGSSVNIHQDQLIVGAITNQQNGHSAGAAYIFEYLEDQWRLQQSIMGNEEQGNFGNKVKVVRDQAFVSAFYSKSHGEVFVYSKEGEAWVQSARLAPQRDAKTYGFGNDLAVHDNLLVVSDYVENSIYLYRKNGNTWTYDKKVSPPDRAEGDLFGKAISVSGNMLMVGAIGDDDLGQDCGSVYLIDIDQ